MPLDANDLKKGLKFLVGTWGIDFLVNIFSNNLDHLPASEFKSKDGKDLSQITWEFFEDHTMKLKNGATGEEEKGTWEQVSDDKFKYKCDKFFSLLPPETLEQIQELQKDMEGGLVFNMLFIIRMKKTAEGVVTEEKVLDIGDIKPTPEELQKKEIVGRYKVYKALTCVDGKFDLFTREEVEADAKKKIAAGEMKQAELDDTMTIFNAMIEFTDDHKVLEYSMIPPDVSKEEIDEAVASGEVKVVDGMICSDEEAKEWKYVKGDYYYNSGEKCVIMGEVQSPWKKLTPDSNGRIEFRMIILERK